MPPVGFEPTIPAGERPQTHALDRAATGTSQPMKIRNLPQFSYSLHYEYKKINPLQGNKPYLFTNLTKPQTYSFCVLKQVVHGSNKKRDMNIPFSVHGLNTASGC